MTGIASVVALLGLLVMLALRIRKERRVQTEARVIAPSTAQPAPVGQGNRDASTETGKPPFLTHLRAAGSRSETITI